MFLRQLPRNVLEALLFEKATRKSSKIVNEEKLTAKSFPFFNVF